MIGAAPYRRAEAVATNREPPCYARDMARKAAERSRSDDTVYCSVFDQARGRPCGEPAEPDSLTCKAHRARPTRTQLSRLDAARKRYG